jgi:hypothetical protein
MYEGYTAEHGSIPEYPAPNVHLQKGEAKKLKKKKNGRKTLSPGKKRKKK